MSQMTLRKLTDFEIEQVNKAKRAASDKLCDMRAKLRKPRGSRLSPTERNNLANQLAALAAPTGKPVIVEVEGERIYLDYELLKKFLRSLHRHKFSYWFKVDGLDFDRKLTVSYQQDWRREIYGAATLLEIPPRQRDLLLNLPSIELLN